jgi:hypothetical protein
MSRFTRSSVLAVSLIALGLPFAGTPIAHAEGVFSRVPTVHVAINMLQSQAQLAEQLRGEGYMDVVLSSAYPSLANPTPQNNPTLTNHPEQTPVHSGWNGVALRNGVTFQVYAGR